MGGDGCQSKNKLFIVRSTQHGVWGREWTPTRVLDLFLQFDEVEEVDILEFGLSTIDNCDHCRYYDK